MTRRSLTSVFNTVLLVCTWIVFMVIEVQAIPNHKYVQCQEMLERITRHTEVLEVYVNPKELQECIVLWAKWRDELIRHGGLSFPTPGLLDAELKQMLTQQARQAGHDPSEQVEQPNMMVAAHQPQEGQSKTKRLKVEPPARPWDFIHRQQQPVPYLKPKSPQAIASKQEQATGARPTASEKFEQPNEVAGVQQPQSSVASSCDVRFELHILQKDLPPSRRLKTLGSDCMKLIGNLLVTPNSPIPTASELSSHQIIVQDCAKVWEKLRDNAVNDHNKKIGLERELGLIKNRLEQIKARSNERKRKRPIGGQDWQPNANDPKVAPPSPLNPHRRPNLQNAPSAALGKEPGPSGGGSNRNFDIPRRHRSKHSKKVRNRMAKSKPKWSRFL